MDTLIFTYKTAIDAPMKQVWDFFQDPKNLSRIQRFPKVNLTQLGDEEGTQLKMKVGYMGLGVQWHSTIETIKKPHYFIDVATKPVYPFTYWRHTHRFVREEGRSMVIDEVEFTAKVPSMVTKKLLTYMFHLREKQLVKHFQKNQTTQSEEQ
ncbi:SRPBCC family protein [Alkalicoccobacillus porphyridii]|uniref:Coenzyme Q-binding protein COQ10 START domain-containing protein n=1 Tax=Alkalicoccobacillus porphyridii TaxID=2597270 RepID=A0A553ZZ02_9BACI|nr:SRPBCC family protein [Alkalicoccobacillus porphyridii]TSB46671.1 hypothetical protein FN960_09960 [Alkalicoccobacillus porphyridii]